MAEVPTEDLFGRPSEARSSGARLSDYKGSLVILKGKDFREIETAYGPKEAAVADLWIVGDSAEPQGDEVLAFNGAIIGTLKRAMDNDRPMVVGVLTDGAAKAGQNPPLILEDPTDDEFNEAVSWFKKSRPSRPAAAPTAAATQRETAKTSSRRRPAAAEAGPAEDAPF